MSCQFDKVRANCTLVVRLVEFIADGVGFCKSPYDLTNDAPNLAQFAAAYSSTTWSCLTFTSDSRSMDDAFVDQSTPATAKNTNHDELPSPHSPQPTVFSSLSGSRRSANGGAIARCSCGSCLWWTCEKLRKRRNFGGRYRMFNCSICDKDKKIKNTLKIFLTSLVCFLN